MFEFLCYVFILILISADIYHFVVLHFGDKVTLTLCISIPSSSEVSHHLTGGQVTMEVLIRAECR